MSKETSAHVASIAAQYLDVTGTDLLRLMGDERYSEKLVTDIRSMAASCLSQREADTAPCADTLVGEPIASPAEQKAYADRYERQNALGLAVQFASSDRSSNYDTMDVIGMARAFVGYIDGQHEPSAATNLNSDGI